jgi:hypothetical protein
MSSDLQRMSKETNVTIQKKSLISTLNTTKKAIVASTPVASASTSEPRASARRTNARPSARRTNARPSARRTNARPSARKA